MFSNSTMLKVAEDLEFFQKDIWTDQPLPDVIRLSSVILRRFLFEDAAGKAWRALGMDKQPKVKVIDLENTINASGIRLDDIVMMLALDFEWSSVGVQTMVLVQGGEAPPISIKYREVGISELSTMPCGYMNPKYLVTEIASLYDANWPVVSVGDIVKYIAHIRGGVHFPQDSPRKKEIRLLKVCPFEQLFGLKCQFNDLEIDGALLMILTVGHWIGKAEDSKKLANAIRQTVG